MQITKTPAGAWQISATVSNGHDSWTEYRTYYETTQEHATTSFYNSVWSMGWSVL